MDYWKTSNCLENRKFSFWCILAFINTILIFTLNFFIFNCSWKHFTKTSNSTPFYWRHWAVSSLKQPCLISRTPFLQPFSISVSFFVKIKPIYMNLKKLLYHIISMYFKKKLQFDKEWYVILLTLSDLLYFELLAVFTLKPVHRQLKRS